MFKIKEKDDDWEWEDLEEDHAKIFNQIAKADKIKINKTIKIFNNLANTLENRLNKKSENQNQPYNMSKNSKDREDRHNNGKRMINFCTPTA